MAKPSAGLRGFPTALRVAERMVGRALLHVRTARHLLRGQLWQTLSHRMLPDAGAALAPPPVAYRRLDRRTPWLPSPAPAAAPDTIEFLHQRRAFVPEAPDWHAADMSKLWRYNLHYFDYLHWSGHSEAVKCALVDHWIGACPANCEVAWEPYPLSLRVVNWMKFASERRGAPPLPASWVCSLAQQLTWLADRVEHHVLANHLLVNGKALAFGGLYLEGPAAAAWRRQGLSLLVAQADEQFLPDGGHFERSFQYHGLALMDLLDVLNVLLANPGFTSEQDLGTLSGAARRGLRFLEQTVAADGRIPLFNDSAFGIAPEPADLLRYGAAVLGEPVPVSVEPLRVCLPDTGYFGYRHGGDGCLVDCGPVGPDYQPAHAHCDTLSYELCVDGLRVVVDGGVYDYEPGEMRTYVRSTAAHNTVRVDGAEQSEIWGAFRVARRAYPVNAELSELEDGKLEFRGGHTGYRHLRGGVQHDRTLRMELAGRWQVIDRVTGRGHHRIESFVHLHPAVVVRSSGPSCFLLERDGVRLRLSVRGAVRVTERGGWHCPEFGLRRRNTVLVLEAEGTLPLELGYTIERT